MSLPPLLHLFRSAPLLIPINGTRFEATTQGLEKLRVADRQIVIGFVPFFALLPPGLTEVYPRNFVADGLERPGCCRPFRCNVYEHRRSLGGHYKLRFGREVDDRSSAGCTARKMGCPFTAFPKFDNRARRQPGAQTGTGCKGGPHVLYRCGDIRLEEKGFFGLRLFGDLDTCLSRKRQRKKRKDWKDFHTSWLTVQVNHSQNENATSFGSGTRNVGAPNGEMARQSQTRQRLIESALYLFWERGFAGTSMSDLLGRAEVNSGSFYHFFDSKEALLKAVLKLYLEALGPQIVRPAHALTSDPIERIFAILAGYRERILRTNCQYGCPLGRLALEIDPENRPAHALIAENFRGWIAAVRDCLEEAKDRILEGTDLDALATYVLVSMEGGVMLSRSYASVDPFDMAVKQLRIHFELLAPSAGLNRRRGTTKAVKKQRQEASA